YAEIGANTFQGQSDARLLFYGRSAEPGSNFSIVGESDRESFAVSGQIFAVPGSQPVTSQALQLIPEMPPSNEGTPSAETIPATVAQPNPSGRLLSPEPITRTLLLSFSGG